MSSFVGSSETKLSKLHEKKAAMLSALSDTTRYLGQDANEVEPEQLLSRIHAFAVSFGKACRDNERADLMRKKQQQVKQQQANISDGAKREGGGLRAVVRKKLAVPNHVMKSIQGSLRRGEFAQMKEMQAQMSHELAHCMAVRRNSITGSDD